MLGLFLLGPCMQSSKILLPPIARKWLDHSGSLTEKIERGFQTTLEVQSCCQGEAIANRIEKHLIRLTPQLFGHKKASQGWCREVILGVGQIPYLYARILVPKPAQTRLIRVKASARQPLGRWLYKDHQTRRTRLYVNYFSLARHRFGLLSQWHAEKLAHLANQSSVQALIRCSHIRSQNTRLLVTEVYLANLLKRLDQGFKGSHL